MKAFPTPAPLLVSLLLMVVPAFASYYEEWIVELTIIEVYDEAKTAKLLKDTDMQAIGKTRVAIKAKVDKCTYKQGHGRSHCTAGETTTIMLSYTKAQAKEAFKKGDKIKAQYSFSNGLTPDGVVNSHTWKLLTD